MHALQAKKFKKNQDHSAMSVALVAFKIAATPQILGKTIRHEVFRSENKII